MCCGPGYSEVLNLNSTALLILLKLTLVSDKGVIGARQLTFEHLPTVDCTRVIWDRPRPVTAHALQQGGSLGIKAACHSDFILHPETLTEGLNLPQQTNAVQTPSHGRGRPSVLWSWHSETFLLPHELFCELCTTDLPIRES